MTDYRASTDRCKRQHVRVALHGGAPLTQALRRLLISLFGLMGIRHGDTIHYIGGSVTLPSPLEREKEREYLEKLKTGDAAVRQALIEHNLRLVVYIARKFENSGVSLEDLISIGTIGLIKAVNTFDTDKNIKLATYASRCIENEILMFLRRNSRTRLEISLDEPLNTDWDGNELLLSDILGTDADLVSRNIEAATERELLAQAMRVLSTRERRIVMLRFGIPRGPEYTQREVADMLLISQSYISRIEKRIMSRLRAEMVRLGS